MEFLFIKDTWTDKSLLITRQSPVPYQEQLPYLVIKDNLEPEVVKRGSIRKVIRAWVKEVEKKGHA